MTAMLWPVFSFANPSQPVVAYFFDYGDAVDFVNENLWTCNLYIGPAKYDRRVRGYRPAVPILDLETRHLGDDRYGVAA
jgi:hypothetical protein